MLLVVSFEHVLLLEESEEHHRLVERQLDFLFRHALDALLEFVVDEEGQVLGRLAVQVEEMFEIRGYHFLKVGIVLERVDKEVIITILQVEETLKGTENGKK